MSDKIKSSIPKPEGYTDQAPAPELDLVSRVHGRFKGIGLVMPAPQRAIYEHLVTLMAEEVRKYRGFPKHIYKASVADVGCGLGIGSNILSQEAQFVWGIDNNVESIEYAKQMFARRQNNIYYTPQVTFDVVDILGEPRQMATFDYVACIEVIEHLAREQAEDLIRFLKRLCHRDKNGNIVADETRTKIFLTTPNRNCPRLGQNTPINPHHCYEMNAGEGYALFTQHFKAVTVMNKDFVPQELNTTESPIVFKLEIPT